MHPQRIAGMFFSSKSFSKSAIGTFLGDRRQLSQDCLKAVCERMDFTGMAIDEALRLFQNHVRIQSEAQVVERLIEAFSARYAVCNLDDDSTPPPDTVFALAFSIILLNTGWFFENVLEKDGIGWKWKLLKTAENGRKWLKMTQNGGFDSRPKITILTQKLKFSQNHPVLICTIATSKFTWRGNNS